MVTVVKFSQYPNSIPIGRKTALGNPFGLDSESQRTAVVEGYRRYLALCALHKVNCVDAANQVSKKMNLTISPGWRRPNLETFLAALKQLRLAVFTRPNVLLGCSGNCAPRPCHGDPLASYLKWCCANATAEERQQYGLATAIIGSRDYPSKGDLDRAVKQCGWVISKVLCGEARGPDTWGREWAESRNIAVDSYPAQWDVHGKRAGYLRNEQMIADAQAVIALWDGKSNGTKHAINTASRLQLRIWTTQPQIIQSTLDIDGVMSDNNEQMT